jgi:CRISPR-associated protein Cas5d
MSQNNRVTLRVWGDFACFTRPEMKVERVSYPVMTPSAARGILEAVFWEPEMYYLIDTIHIVKRGSWFSTRRNEINTVVSIHNVKQWMESPDKSKPIQAGGGAHDGTQRNMLGLRDVEYLVTAEVRLTELANRSSDNIAKYIEQIRRRASSGKCFHRPYMGVREFDAFFEFVDDAQEAFDKSNAIPIRYEPLGLMLYDVFDYRLFEKGFKWLDADQLETARLKFEKSLVGLKKGEATKRRKAYLADAARLFIGERIKPQPSFFQAEIKDNVLHCHPDDLSVIIQKIAEDPDTCF